MIFSKTLYRLSNWETCVLDNKRYIYVFDTYVFSNKLVFLLYKHFNIHTYTLYISLQYKNTPFRPLTALIHTVKDIACNHGYFQTWLKCLAILSKIVGPIYFNHTRTKKSSRTLYYWFIVFNTTFNNISVVSWRSVLLVEETRVHRENDGPARSHWPLLSDMTFWLDVVSSMSTKFILESLMTKKPGSTALQFHKKYS